MISPNATPKIINTLSYVQVTLSNKMTKLQIINTFLTERLMAALNEIMDMVGGTVLQYETELESIQKDNEYLRRRLQEIEKQFEPNGTLSLPKTLCQSFNKIRCSSVVITMTSKLQRSCLHYSFVCFAL